VPRLTADVETITPLDGFGQAAASRDSAPRLRCAYARSIEDAGNALIAVFFKARDAHQYRHARETASVWGSLLSLERLGFARAPLIRKFDGCRCLLCCKDNCRFFDSRSTLRRRAAILLSCRLDRHRNPTDFRHRRRDDAASGAPRRRPRSVLRPAFSSADAEKALPRGSDAAAGWPMAWQDC
jgi:hypothetical protein